MTFGIRLKLTTVFVHEWLSMLHVRNLTYRIAGRTIIDDASLDISKGHRCGLVGINGSGKTTLFGLITGDLLPDDGLVQVSGAKRIGIVEQEAPTSDKSLLDFVLSSDKAITELQAEAESNPQPNRLAEIYDLLRDMDAQTAVSRAASILSGLGFDETEQGRPCNEFSGGWRMRVALACTLFARPELLLLDEPTNHLDLESTLWLKTFLARFPGTLVVISHDRDLLNQSVKRIIHLENGKLHSYQGGYDQFRKKTSELTSQREMERNKQVKERERIQAFVTRFRAKATKARQAQSRLKFLEKMDPLIDIVETQSAPIHFPQPKELLAPPLVTINNVSLGYGDKTVLRNLNLQIDPDDRIAILGANGLGKSTLIKLLAEKLKPINGTLQHSTKLKFGYFSQDQTDQLSDGATPFEILQHRASLSTEEALRSHLGAFGFSGASADTDIANLSGGEKSRLLFCLMSTNAPNLLLLDEPTNHLDIMGRESLISSLNNYTGAVILVSHDTHIINLVAERLWLVSDGTCSPYEGTLDNYQDSLSGPRATLQKTGLSVKNESPGPVSRRRQRQKRAEKRENTTELRRLIKLSEQKIDDLSKVIGDLERELADPEIYNSENSQFANLSQHLDKARKQLSTEEQTWLSALEKLESEKASS